MATASEVPSEIGVEAVRALKIIQSLPGHTWSADAAGRFIYVGQGDVALLGHNSGHFDRTGKDDEVGWRHVVHPDDYDRVIDSWQHCLETGDHFDIEHRLQGTDGLYRWFRNSGWPSRDDQGRVTGWYGAALDIDAQKRAEAALRNREQELSQLVDMAPSHLWRLDPDGEPTFFNQRMVDFLGMDVADTIKPGMSRLAAMIEAAVHPDDTASFEGVLGRCLQTGERFALQYRLRRADGAYRWMSSRAEPMRDEDGAIVQWHGLCFDIDDNKHAEDALRQSERQLQQMIDAVPVRIWSTTPSGGAVYFNRRYHDYLRTVVAQAETLEAPRIEQLLEELVHPQDAPEVRRTLQNSFETGDPCVMRFRWREAHGTYRWAECRVEPRRDQDGTIVQWYGASLDVDDEVRAQEALRLRERELSQLVDMVPVHIARMAPDGEPTFFSKRTAEYIGLGDVAAWDKPGMSRVAAIIGASVHPEDAPLMRERLSHALGTGEPYTMRYRLRGANGQYRWHEGRAEPLRDERGLIAQWYAAAQDIDDQVEAEEALRESERQLRLLIDTVPVQIWCVTPAGAPSYINKTMMDYIGLSLEDFDAEGGLSSAIQRIVHPDDRAALQRRLGHSFGTGEPFAMKYRNRRWDGTFRWNEGHAEPLRDAAGHIIQWYGVNVDIDDETQMQSALRAAQDRLARATRAASLAELSASIAHEVNQPLAAVVANSDACKRWLAADPPNLERVRSTVDRIIRDANAASDVVTRIRALFRQSVDRRVFTTLERIITEARILMAEEASQHDVDVSVEIESDLPSVAVDRVQIQQVLVNLMRNGIEAMDTAPDDKHLVVRVRRMAGIIETAISDHGPGIVSPDRLFEPFYTTKEHGMGMGLAICRSIVESHGGRLWVEKNEPTGATFIFTLPADDSSGVANDHIA